MKHRFGCRLPKWGEPQSSLWGCLVLNQRNHQPESKRPASGSSSLDTGIRSSLTARPHTLPVPAHPQGHPPYTPFRYSPTLKPHPLLAKLRQQGENLCSLHVIIPGLVLLPVLAQHPILRCTHALWHIYDYTSPAHLTHVGPAAL